MLSVFLFHTYLFFFFSYKICTIFPEEYGKKKRTVKQSEDNNCKSRKRIVASEKGINMLEFIVLYTVIGYGMEIE